MSRSNAHRQPSQLSGFTLVEVMVSSLIFGTVSIATMGAFLFLGTSTTRLAYAQQLEENSRRAFYLFNQDAGMATLVTPDSSTPSSKLVFTLPASSVTYTYDSSAKTLTRSAGTPAIVLKNLTAFQFNYFDKAALTAVTLPQTSPYRPIKGVQFAFTATLGANANAAGTATIYRTAARFQTVSPIVFLRNTTSDTLLPP